jgi:hypothetical protein
MRAFPGSFLKAVAAGMAAVMAIALAGAVLRIREQRAWRYGALAAAVALFGWYGWAFRTGSPSVDTVERFHFIEYGLIAFLFFRAWRPSGDGAAIGLTLLTGILVGTLEEWVQWVVPVRTGEARDVFLNLYALVCGVLFSVAFVRIGRVWPLPSAALSRLAAVAAMVVAVFGAFAACAHLGHVVVDPDGTTFRSYFTAERLLALQPQRARDWRADPPRELKTLALEDYYMTEAGWHVQERNRAYERGDFGASWRENRILERYYDPFLDLISFIGGVRHRWPAEPRAFVEVRAHPSLAAAYECPVGEGRIVTALPVRLYWAIVGTLTTVLAGLAMWLRRPAIYLRR